MIVLDTNVLAELFKRSPAEAVTLWMAAQPAASLFTTTITQAETLSGLALLPAARRRSALTAAANAMFEAEFAAASWGSTAPPRESSPTSQRPGVNWGGQSLRPMLRSPRSFARGAPRWLLATTRTLRSAASG